MCLHYVGINHGCCHVYGIKSLISCFTNNSPLVSQTGKHLWKFLWRIIFPFNTYSWLLKILTCRADIQLCTKRLSNCIYYHKRLSNCIYYQVFACTSDVTRPRFQVSAAPRHRPYWRPSVRTYYRHLGLHQLRWDSNS